MSPRTQIVFSLLLALNGPPLHAQIAATPMSAVVGIVLDGPTRMPAGKVFVRVFSLRGGNGRSADEDGRFGLNNMVAGDSATLTVRCAPGDRYESRIIGRSTIVLLPNVVPLEVLVNRAACTQVTETRRYVRVSGQHTVVVSPASSTFRPCRTDPIATLMSEWDASMWISFAPDVHRLTSALPPARDSTRPTLSYVTFAGVLRGPGDYGGATHSPYELVVDSVLFENADAHPCGAGAAAPVLQLGSVKLVDIKVDPRWAGAPKKDLPVSKLPNHVELVNFLTDDFGRVPGARITLEPTGISAVTDTLGNYVLHEVPVGDYKLWIQRVGYRTDFARIMPRGPWPPGTTFLNAQRVPAGPYALTDSARRAKYPGAYDRSKHGIGLTILGHAARVRYDGARRPILDQADPKLAFLMRTVPRCGQPAYFVDGYQKASLTVVNHGVTRIEDLVKVDDIDLVQVVPSQKDLNPIAPDDARVLMSLPPWMCRPLVLIWTRY